MGIEANAPVETAYWMQRVDLQSLMQNTQENGEVPPELAYIDLRFGNQVTLACVMCSPMIAVVGSKTGVQYTPKYKTPDQTKHHVGGQRQYKRQ